MHLQNQRGSGKRDQSKYLYLIYGSKLLLHTITGCSNHKPWPIKPCSHHGKHRAAYLHCTRVIHTCTCSDKTKVDSFMSGHFHPRKNGTNLLFSLISKAGKILQERKLWWTEGDKLYVIFLVYTVHVPTAIERWLWSTFVIAATCQQNWKRDYTNTSTPENCTTQHTHEHVLLIMAYGLCPLYVYM